MTSIRNRLATLLLPGDAITWTSTSITRDANSSVFCDLGVTSFRVDATK